MTNSITFRRRPLPGLVPAAILAIWLVASAANGQTAHAPAKAPAPKPPVAEVSDVSRLTCGELLFMFGDEKQTQDTTYLVLWAYGVKTGMSGLDLRKHPLTPDGLKTFVKDLYQSCKDRSDVKLIDVLARNSGAGK